jgi:hypothetical protein
VDLTDPETRPRRGDHVPYPERAPVVIAAGSPRTFARDQYQAVRERRGDVNRLCE